MKVAALAGRRIDAEEMPDFRFPLSQVKDVSRRVENAFREEEVTWLVCSAACGADLIALQTADTLGIQAVVILPFSPKKFYKSSVSDRPGDWFDLYWKSINTAEKRGKLINLELSCNENNAYKLVTERIIEEMIAISIMRVSFVLWDGVASGEDDETLRFKNLSQKKGVRIRTISTNDQ